MASRMRALAWKLGSRGPRRLLRGLARRADLRASTYGPSEGGEAELARMMPRLPAGALEPSRGWITAVAELYAAHRFDLLGSGWVRVIHGASCAGVEGHGFPPAPAVSADAEGAWLRGRVNDGNAAEAARVWRLVRPGYTPVDWHLDFKSGYRWREDAWYRDVRPGGAPGVDIKVPWELGRMQHLPQLAWAHALAVEDGDAPAAARWAGEFRDQVLDWIACNPPRFGVNWASTMDVGIRAANWVVAYDLFRAWGAEFDGPFRAELVRSLRAHGLHIAANLEWEPEHRGNHYLANVAGLLFTAAALPAGAEADAWLAWSVQELVAETEFQFHRDGSNFEGSTAYHRLSLEMVAASAARVLGLSAERKPALERYDHRRMGGWPALAPAPLPRYADGRGGEAFFPPAFAERLARALEFSRDTTAPGGGVVQVGDNDSGRFLKLSPALRLLPAAEAAARFATLPPETVDTAGYWYEDPLDHAGGRALTAAVLGMEDAGGNLDGVWARGVAGGAVLAGAAAGAARESAGTAPGAAPAGAVETVFRASGGDLRAGLRTAAYPDFGLWILRSHRLYLAVRCGAVGQHGRGGHAHLDQLAIELWIDGVPLARDPGTYLYTPLPERRNEYRSVSVHHAPRVQGREPGDLGQGPFRLSAAEGRCLRFGADGFAGVHDGYGFPLHRRVHVHADAVRIVDFAEDAPAGTVLAPGPAAPRAFSPGYGILES